MNIRVSALKIVAAAILACMVLPSGLAAGGSSAASPGQQKSSVRLTFAHMSDLHCAEAATNPKPDFPCDPHVKDLVRSFRWLQAAVRDINTHVKPSFVTITGDIADRGSDLKSLRRARDILNGLKCPFYPVIGDHGQPRRYRRVFDRPMNYVFRSSGWRFIALDCHSGAVSKTGIQLLQKTTNESANGPPTVLLLHRPLSINPLAVKLAQTLYSAQLELQTRNAGRILDIAEKSRTVRAVMAGHVHTNTSRALRGLQQFTTGSLVEEPHAYRVFRVKGGRLSSTLRHVTLQTPSSARH